MKIKDINEIKQRREGKNWFFKNHPHSPLPQKDKKEFSGLSYFPINPDYQFILSLNVHTDKKQLT